MRFQVSMYSRQVMNLTRSLGRIEGGFAVAKAKALLRRADVVIMDVDSTIIRKEGIDILASYLHKEKEIKELKRQLICVIRMTL